MKKDISRIVLYGERCSGTNYTERLVRSFCSTPVIPTTGAIIRKKTNTKNNWFGHKHFFGFHSEVIDKYQADTLFICVVRNPYNWIMSFYNQQWHVPYHNGRTIEAFINNEWYSVQKSYIINTETHSSRSTLRAALYAKHHPSMFKNNKHIVVDDDEIPEDRNYENNHRYRNIFHLRKNKLAFMHTILPVLASNILYVKYEDINHNPEFLLEQLQQYNICLRKNYKIEDTKNKKNYTIPNDICDQITKRLNWKTEKLYGYHKE